MGSNTRLPETFLDLVRPTNTCCLTKRAPDWWASPRQRQLFLLVGVLPYWASSGDPTDELRPA